MYVDDIIFRSDDEKLSEDFAKKTQQEFKMSFLGEMNLFLGLQIVQCKKEIFIHQSKYIKDMLKTFQLEDGRHVCTPMTVGYKLRK